MVERVLLKTPATSRLIDGGFAGLGRRGAQAPPPRPCIMAVYQRRAHVMAHHVANEQTHGCAEKWNHVKEIPADGAGREKEAQELQIAFRAWFVARHTGEFMRQHGQLQFARHFQFFGGLLVLLFQFLVRSASASSTSLRCVMSWPMPTRPTIFPFDRAAAACWSQSAFPVRLRRRNAPPG